MQSKNLRKGGQEVNNLRPNQQLSELKIDSIYEDVGNVDAAPRHARKAAAGM
jgi:hypothetical protein